jgi:hypothetical protein
MRTYFAVPRDFYFGFGSDVVRQDSFSGKTWQKVLDTCGAEFLREM